MKEIQELFVQLLQVSVNNRLELTTCPNDEEWASLFIIAKKQALVGIAFKGIEKLPSNQQPPRILMLKWSGIAIKQIEVNSSLTAQCQGVSEKFDQAGFDSCVLKGQGNLFYYTDYLKMYRTSGDIDLWLMPQKSNNCNLTERRRRIVSYCTAVVGEQRIVYHHMDFPIKGSDIEVHFTPSWMKSPIHNRRLQKFFDAEWNNRLKIEDGFYIPSLRMNVIYQLVHIYRHLFNEGIGLRQFLDYYFVLLSFDNNQSKYDRREVLSVITSLGMSKFASAAMYVLQSVFAIPENYLLTKPNAKVGHFLLEEIMQAGSFGRYDDRAKGEYATKSWSHRWYKIKRSLKLFVFFPSEVFWAPYFNWIANHGLWRRKL